MGALEDTLDYHQLSKHQPDRYARGPGYLDWSNQPDPFRCFAGASEHRLPLFSAAKIDGEFDRVAALLQRSLAISAWKQHGGQRWALRCNPSSGNLHPTEAYLALPRIGADHPGAGIYHYRSRDHVLERRCALCDDDFERLMGMLPDGFLVGLSTIEWREAWKYGDRAFRYCHLDVGHAIAAVSYAAATLGLRAVLMAEPADAEVASLFGLDRGDDFEGAEREHPDAVLFVGAAGQAGAGWPDAGEVARMRAQSWTGRANVLSASPIEWKAVNKVELATRRTVRGAVLPSYDAQGHALRPFDANVLLKRRSAMDFELGKGMSQEQLWSILERAMPGASNAPWDAVWWQPHVHLVILVHQVEGLEPGLYCLPRRSQAREPLADAMSGDWEWEPVAAAPAHVPLLRLAAMNARSTSGFISCQQSIASDGAAAFAMMAEFEGPLRTLGPWMYRRLLWECGAIGQALYLGAEACGLRATGIGCFFDDLAHELVGLDGQAYQSLYHLAIGTPVEDARIKTLPAYGT
jgi:SagB-type dehydrogenase family enzyme